MRNPRWRKVIRDLWDHKGRTIMVVLSIAVGVFAVGMIMGSDVLLNDGMNGGWASVNPAQATLYPDNFDEGLVETVRHMPGVAEADARRNLGLRFKVGDASVADNDDIPWRNVTLVNYLDFDEIRIYKLRSLSGPFPPPDKEMLIERASLAWMGVKPGDTITVEDANGKVRELKVAGVVHDLTAMAGAWMGRATGYVSSQTMTWLGLAGGYNEMNVITTGENPTKEEVQAVADRVVEKIEKSNRTVWFTWVPPVGEHPAAEVMTPVMMIMGVMGFLSLLLSGLLVVNTLQAQLSQQTRQIGIMKSIGGQAGQILGIYYAMVFIFAALALALAIPLGAVGAKAMSQFMATMINFDLPPTGLSPRVVLIQLGVGLLVPVIAALVPILSAVRVTAREAMSDYGLNPNKKRGRFDRMIDRIRGFSRPVLLSLRNTFRRKGRLVLTLTTLVLGGAIFIGVFTVRDSLLLTLDDMFDYVDYDAYVGFKRGYRIEQLEEEALKVPGVKAAESWRFSTARRLRPDDSESENLAVYAPPPDSKLVNPNVIEGRWLLPEDENAIVINTLFLKDEKDVKVGDTLTLKMEGDESGWQVVGIIKGTPPQAMAYVNLPYFSRVVGGVGRGGVVFTTSNLHDLASQQELAKRLEDHFESIGMQVGNTQTSATERGQIESQFNVLVVFLLIMAILLAVVGGIGLMGTMSLNVMERTREIGVMRAIGATNGSIFKIVVIEGIVIGVLSWLIGTVLAYPLSVGLSNAVGVSILQAPLSYRFSLFGMGLWLMVVIVLATLASLWPARSASKVTVREVLAYE